MSRATPEHVVRDPVHGIIRLTVRQRRVLNALVVQRLREVRQLHLAPLIFPGASHSTLAHAIGTIGAFQRMIQQSRLDLNSGVPVGIRKRLEATGLDAEEATELALLLAFVGRPAFNYVLQAEPDATVFETPAIRKALLETGPTGLAESCGLVEDAPAGAALLRESPRYVRPDAPDGFIHSNLTGPQLELVQDIVDENVPLLSDFLTHPAGPDVLDYVDRDSIGTGFHHLRLDDAIYSCFIIARAGHPDVQLKIRDGTLAVDSTTRLFDSIAHLARHVSGHHTVMAARAMVKEAITLVWREDRQAALHLLTEDEVLGAIITRDRNLVQGDVRTLEQARGLARRVLVRQLYKRAMRFAVTPGTASAATALLQRSTWTATVESIVKDRESRGLPLSEREIPILLRTSTPVPLVGRVARHRRARAKDPQIRAGERSIEPILGTLLSRSGYATQRVLYVFAPRSGDLGFQLTLAISQKHKLGGKAQFDFDDTITELDWLAFFGALGSRTTALRILHALARDHDENGLWMTATELQEELKIEEGTVWTHLKAIEKVQASTFDALVRKRDATPNRFGIASRGMRVWLSEILSPVADDPQYSARRVLERIRVR